LYGEVVKADKSAVNRSAGLPPTARLNHLGGQYPLPGDRADGSDAGREYRVDRSLVDRAKGGDGEAFDALARQVGDRCIAIAHRILRDGDLAEDAVQAALIVAWRELRTLRDPDRFEPWLHRILTNECYAEARRRSRRSADIRVLHVDSGPEAPAILSVNDRDQLERAFRRLTLEQRAVLVFHHYLDLTVVEVAERLGIPLGTAKSRLYHATNALRASLEADARTQIDTQERLA
jgi:RNA polymerase sigma factor (sigma-70 family)